MIPLNPPDDARLDELFDENSRGKEVSPADFQALASLAAAGDWTAYLALADSLGSGAPSAIAAPDPEPRSREQAFQSLFEHWGPPENALAAGLRLLKREDRPTALRGLCSLLPARAKSGILERMLFSYVADENLWIHGHQLAPPAELVEMGAPMRGPLDAAGAAARWGNEELLFALLDCGLDARAWTEGSQGWEGRSLLLLALHKERAATMSEKMKCAERLWTRGARLDFFPGLPGPSCALDLHFGLGADPAWDAGEESFRLSLPYFSEAGMPAWSLLPDGSDLRADARLLAAAEPSLAAQAGEPDGQWAHEALGILRSRKQARDLHEGVAAAPDAPRRQPL